MAQMEELKNQIEDITMKELERANRKFPKFNSLHEGHGVILEELHETQEELDQADKKLKLLWWRIRENDTAGAKEFAEGLRNRAILAACEAIQTAAMAQKFIDSFGGVEKNEQA